MIRLSSRSIIASSPLFCNSSRPEMLTATAAWRIGYSAAVKQLCLFACWFITSLCMLPCSSDYIFARVGRWALVGPLFFRQALVSIPSASLALIEGYIRGSARYYPGGASTEFTQIPAHNFLCVGHKNVPATERCSTSGSRCRFVSCTFVYNALLHVAIQSGLSLHLVRCRGLVGGVIVGAHPSSLYTFRRTLALCGSARCCLCPGY